MAKETIKKQKANPEKEFNVFNPEDIKARKKVIANKEVKLEASKNPRIFTDEEKKEMDKLMVALDLKMDFELKDDYSFNQGTHRYSGSHIICAGIIKGKVEKEETEEDDDGKPKALDAKEIKRIQTEIRAQVKALLLLPPPPYVTITPALKISKLGAPALCTYAIDKIIRTQAILTFTSCVPSTSAVQLVYTNLLALAGVNTNTLNASDKSNKKLWTKQLKKMLFAMATSCASLADGNLALYLLTGMGVKAAGVHHDEQLPVCVFELTTNKGPAKIGVKCKAIPYAKNYTIYYSNLPVFDIETAQKQTGSSNQVLTDLIKGDLYNIVIVANGKDLEGDIAETQSRRAPWN